MLGGTRCFSMKGAASEKPADLPTNSKSPELKLLVSPFANAGGRIVAFVEATNCEQTLLELNAPDTLVISQPHSQLVGNGSFKKKVVWSVEHVRPNTLTMVEVTATSGSLVQKGLCRVTP